MQETHFNLLEEGAFDDNEWITYHSNGDGSKGVVIIVRREMLLYYTVKQIKLHASLEGYALALSFSPLNKHGDAPFTIVNCYLYTGTERGDHFKVKDDQINHLKAIPPSRHFFMGGDFNFLEKREDTTSTTEYHTHPDYFANTWRQFKEKYGISQIHSDSHTYYKICSTAEKSHSSRLDRIYTSYTEADIEMLGLSLSLPNIPHNILSDFNSPWLEDMERNDEENSIISGSDHIPITTQYHCGSEGSTKPSIPVWITKTKAFSAEFRRLWETRPPASDAYREAEHMNELLYQASDFARKHYREINQATLEGRERLDVLIRLLRTLISFDATAEDLTRLRQRYPYLNSYLKSKDWGVNAANLQVIINQLITERLVEKTAEVEGASPFHINNQNIVAKLSQMLPSRRKRLVRLRATIRSDYTSDPAKMAEIVREPLAKIWAKRRTKIKPKEWLRFYSNVIPKELTPNLPNIDDAEEAIAATNDSCPGPDGIPFSAYRAVITLAAPVLISLFKKLTEQDTNIPKDFNHGLLFLIPKTDSGLPLDTRPISVTNSINRLIAKLAVLAITPAVQHLIDKAQKGFIPGRQGGDHIQALNERFYKAVEEGDDHYILFMDTRKAFDSISHDYIHEVLRKFGLPTWFLTLVQNLLRNVLVNPVLGGQSDVWIPIRQGVKQGCPLSPIIFAIVVDPLLRALRDHTKCDAYAFADDLAIDTTKLKRLNLCMRIVDQFGEASGAKQNHGKTAIISAQKDDDVPNWIRTSPWKKLNHPTSYTYLGIKFGRTLKVADIYKKAVNKLVDRANEYSPIAKKLSHAKRVTIYNVFIVSVLTYITNFFLFPYDLDPEHTKTADSLLAKVRKAACKIIIPYGGNAYHYSHLVGDKDRISSLPPIRDITALSYATLASKADLNEWDQLHREDLPIIDAHKSMQIKKHIRAAGLDTVIYHLSSDEWGKSSAFSASDLIKTSPAGNRKRIYNRLVYTIYTWELLNPEVEEVATRRALTIRPCEATNEIRLNDTTPTADLINSNYARLPTRLPHQVRHINFSLYFNSLATTHRRRRFDTNTIKCPMCGHENDNADHLLVSCIPTIKAKEIYAHSLNLLIATKDLSTETFPATSRDITYLNFDGHNKDKEVLAITIFNYSTWYQYRDYFKTLGRPNDLNKSINRLANAALLEYLRLTAPRKAKGYGNANNRTKEQAAAAKDYVERILNSVTPDDIVIYTDGSSLGNPGPAGAGAYIRYPITWGISDVHIAIPLGRGTNNIGELYAIGAATAHVNNTLNNFNIDPNHIFYISDSAYSLGCLTKGWQSDTNKTLIRAVKHLIRDIPHADNNTCKWFWTPGHADIYGNNIADKLANEGSSLSKKGKGPDPNTLNNNINNRAFLEGATCTNSIRQV